MPVRPLIPVTDPDDPALAPFRAIRERDLTGRENRFIAEGTVVLTMLAAAHGGPTGIRAERLLILENRLANLAALIARFPADVPVHVASQPVLDAIAGFHLHRGVLALGRRAEAPLRDDLLSRLPETALVVAAVGLSNHDNVGALFRNAAAFGAAAVLLDETCCDPLYRKALRVSVGSVLTVPYAREGTGDALIDRLVAEGFDLLALSPAGTLDLRAVSPGRRTALLLGTEGEGLPPGLLARLTTVRIPQRPGLDSLNVATAAAVALYEVGSRMKLV